ncbi:MAG: F0F1 ATP synthase subunit delta [Candidatus Paceibacterota bacterium]
MKITARQYGEILMESLYNKNEGDTKTIIKKFFLILKRNNDLALGEKIVKEFEKAWNKKYGLEEAEVTTVSEIDKETAQIIKDYVRRESGAKTVSIKNNLDKNILGGAIIRYGDKIINLSLSQKLDNFKNQIVK